jgi:hypothetical protein
LHQSGELVRFDVEGIPGCIDAETLRAAVHQLAAATLLGRHWPRQPGTRHDLAMAVAGTCLRGELAATITETIIKAAAEIAGDDEVSDRVAQVASTAKRHSAGLKVTGRSTLIELLGAPVVAKLVEWLRLLVAADPPWPSDDDAPGAHAHALQRTHDASDAPSPPAGEPRSDDQEADAGDTPWAHACPAPEFCATVDETADWLVPGVLMPGAVTRINSPRGIGKTNAGLSYAVTLARAAKRVLLFDRDNPSHLIRNRLRAWGGDVLEAIEVLSREHAPALTETRAWRDFPIGKYDLVVLDSWDASTEGVGEQDSAKPSLAQKALLDLAHRANGPAILVLANTTKSGEAGRGAGTIEDREDIVFEVRDATGVTFTGRPEWWLDLPDASRGSWGERAARRQKRERLRLAFVYSKFRVGIEPDPFALEIDFTTSPWTVREITEDIIAAGQAPPEGRGPSDGGRGALPQEGGRQVPDRGRTDLEAGLCSTRQGRGNPLAARGTAHHVGAAHSAGAGEFIASAFQRFQSGSTCGRTTSRQRLWNAPARSGRIKEPHWKPLCGKGLRRRTFGTRGRGEGTRRWRDGCSRRVPRCPGAGQRGGTMSQRIALVAAVLAGRPGRRFPAPRVGPRLRPHGPRPWRRFLDWAPLSYPRTAITRLDARQFLGSPRKDSR